MIPVWLSGVCLMSRHHLIMSVPRRHSINLRSVVSCFDVNNFSIFPKRGFVRAIRFLIAVSFCDIRPEIGKWGYLFNISVFPNMFAQRFLPFMLKPMSSLPFLTESISSRRFWLVSARRAAVSSAYRWLFINLPPMVMPGRSLKSLNINNYV